MWKGSILSRYRLAEIKHTGHNDAMLRWRYPGGTRETRDSDMPRVSFTPVAVLQSKA